MRRTCLVLAGAALAAVGTALVAGAEARQCQPGLGDDAGRTGRQDRPSRPISRGRTRARRRRVRRIPIRHAKGDFTVWTKRFGTNPRIKLLLLHGGPGRPTSISRSFESFLPRGGDRVHLLRPARLGVFGPAEGRRRSGRSTASWTRSSRCAQGARPHARRTSTCSARPGAASWPSSTRSAHPQELKGLVISNMMMSIPDYNRYANDVLAKQMDPAVVKEIREIEARKASTRARATWSS